MRRMKVRLSALAIAFCAALSLALFGVVAQAAEGDGFSFALTVNATASKEKDFVAEVKRADMVADVYKVAEAEEMANFNAYTYTFVGAFEGLQTTFDAVSVKRDSTAENWQALYDAAAEIVTKGKLEPDKTVAFAEDTGKAEITITEEGIYLVMARGADEDYGAGVAYSDRYKYTFPATMVAAPTKWATDGGDMAGVIYTDDAYADGTSNEWKYNATINLKSSWEPLYGRLIIDKDVIEGYEGEETTFVFRVYDVATGGKDYEEYASITLNGSSTGTTQLTHIPAQMRVEIEETYFGGRYEYVSTRWLTDNVIVSDHDADKSATDDVVPAEVLVNNRRGGNNPGGGHGIENHFDFVPDEGPDDGSFDDWTMRPEKPYTGSATTE